MEQAQTRTVTRPALLLWLRLVAALVVGLVLVQAVLAGQGWFPYDQGTIELHGYVGNATFVAVLAQAALVFLVGFQGRTQTLLLGAAGLLVLLVTAQIGLGYSGRDSVEARSWHIPNGVLIFGLAVAVLSIVAQQPRGR